MLSGYPVEDMARKVGTRRQLSNEECALLDTIRSQSRSQRSNFGVRTGRVSLDELMGLRKFYDMQAFLEHWQNQHCSAKRAFVQPQSWVPFVDSLGMQKTFSYSANMGEMGGKRVPPMATFPSHLYSFAGRYTDLKNSSSLPYNQAECANATGKYSAQAPKPINPQTFGRGRVTDTNGFFPLMPRNKFEFPPTHMSAQSHSPTSMQTTQRNENQPQAKENVVEPPKITQKINLKRPTEKKNYFSEYLNIDAANRGIARGQLYKGVLRVNQRGFEESFLVDATGSLQEDLLIFGLHDRNRALHGDVVVVRVKDRENWLVRDALFFAWREGHLEACVDEDGQPVTVPPIRSWVEEEEILDALNLPLVIDKRDLLQKSKTMIIPRDGKYTREQMLVLLTKLSVENARCFGTKLGTTLHNDILKKLEELCIQSTSSDSQLANGVNCSPSSNHSGSNSRHSQNKFLMHRRYYFLRDLPAEYWGMPNICLQRTAEVVCILEHKNSRAAVGMLKVMADGNRKWALFSPNDSRMPRMMIPAEETPNGFFDRPNDFAKFIYVARVVNWPATAQFARGKLYKSLGLAGDISAETEGLLLASAVDTRSFPASVLASLPIAEDEDWKVDEKEFKYRRDLREEFVFTVRTPKTRVIENAFHIKRIDDCDGKGRPGWEVGVHVADVAYFVNPGTELDQWASFRSTSVKLVNKTVPMLPKVLMDKICSLGIGTDRLCLSVIWKMDETAAIYNEWFGRSVVCLREEITLESAQSIIDQPTGDEELATDEQWSPCLTESLKSFNAVSDILHRRRYERGAIQLQQTELNFQVEENGVSPTGIKVSQSGKYGRFVEEILLLANIAVAREIEKTFGNVTLLRRQCPPKSKMANEALEKLGRIGISLRECSEDAIAGCLATYGGDDEYKKILLQVISYFLSRSMQLPEYLCAGTVASKKELGHFSLAVPFYTHFTSPLNRYADIVVQRFLTAAVGQVPPPRLSMKEVVNIATHCNDKELIAKSVSEANDDMFFGLYVKEHGPLTEQAVVVQILDAAFDVLVVKYGIIKRVYANKLRIVREPRFIEGASPALTLYWDSHENTNASVEQIIQLCSVVDVIISSVPGGIKYQAIMKQPTIGGHAPSLLDGF